VRPLGLFLAPRDACLPKSGRGFFLQKRRVPDLPAARAQVGAYPSDAAACFGCEQEHRGNERYSKNAQGDFERLWSLGDHKRKLLAAPVSADVTSGADAEGSKRSACSRLPATADPIESRTMPSAPGEQLPVG